MIKISHLLTMQVVFGVEKWPGSSKPTVVTIGNFDGIHLGHKEVIRRTVSLAQLRKAVPVVFTFFPHPIHVLYPERGQKRLFSLRDTEAQLRDLGVQLLVIEPFSRKFSQITPLQFLQRWIFERLNPISLVVGYDFAFGSQRSGTLQVLQTLTQERQIQLEVIPAFIYDEEVVSSSRIRELLEQGHVSLAKKLLGRPFYSQGLVEKGQGRGHTIGIPTANLQVGEELLPQSGVYAVDAVIGDKRFPAVVNIGVNPTFVPQEFGRKKVECHILDFHEDVYGKMLRIEYHERIRDEMKFTSPQALVAQIHQDISTAKGLLGLKS